MSEAWQQQVEEFCHRYNISISHLAQILHEPKVIPMIRGKGFEYSVMDTLQKILPSNEWRITKAALAEEASFHDTDIRVFHKRTGKVVRVECKLAKKQGYRLYPDGHSEVRVKCMRSRTLGNAKVKELAPKLGVDNKVLSIHNDQYLPSDFDIVITSIGNAFYRTDKATGLYEWKPNDREKRFLEKLQASDEISLKDMAYRLMFVARTKDLAAKSSTTITCTRKQCKNKTNCGFIPNYPIIYFDATTNRPTNNWVPISEAVNTFKRFTTS